MNQGHGAEPGFAARVARALRVICLALAAFSAGCAGGTETGNPSFTATLSYTGYTSKPDEIGVRTGGSVATVESAWFDLDRIAVSAASTCQSGAAPAFQVPALGVGDHAAGNHNSLSFAAFAGNYCGVDVPFARVSEASGAPNSLLGQALLVTGTLADGTPFEIVSGATPLVRLQAAGDGFSLTEAESDLLLGFDFATWLSALDFSGADRGAGGLVISKDSNPALLEIFESSLAAGLHLFRDRDANGMLDANPEELAYER